MSRPSPDRLSVGPRATPVSAWSLTLIAASICVCGCLQPAPERAVYNAAPVEANAPDPGPEPAPRSAPASEEPHEPQPVADVSPLQSAEPRPLEPPSFRVAAGEISRATLMVPAGGRDLGVRVVRVPLGSFRLKVGLARDRIGATEDLAEIARRHEAIAAINGSFFDAYSKLPAKNPHGSLITGGEVVHIADHPTLIGCWPDGSVRIGKVRFRIFGSLNGGESYPNNWYAYGLNDLPGGSTWAALYTPRWSLERSPADGRQVVVSGGKVTRIGSGGQGIPEDGFVVQMKGKEASMVRKFRVGAPCSYRFGLRFSDPPLDWLQAEEALGCGPMLVRDGAACPDPASEGFRHEKVLSLSCARSAVGLTGDGDLLMVTCSGATIARLADAMKALGCVDAMNLDGGASSGLWCAGSYMTSPGRQIANALLVLPRGS